MIKGTSGEEGRGKEGEGRRRREEGVMGFAIRARRRQRKKIRVIALVSNYISVSVGYGTIVNISSALFL